MKKSRLSLNKTLILKYLLDGKPKTIKEINEFLGNFKGEKRDISNTITEIERMVRQGYLNYKSESVYIRANQIPVAITDAGTDKYNEFRNEFEQHFQYLSKVKDYINS